MNRAQDREYVNSSNRIKFIGVGHKGVEIINKISENKKEYMNLATVDIKNNNINENIDEQITYANDIYEWCWWSKCDFFELIDTIGQKSTVLKNLIKEEKMLVVICDDCDLVSLHTLLEIGKIGRESNILTIPIIIDTQNKSKTKQSDSKFFIKKLNREVGPVISLSKKDFNNIDEEYEIINMIIEMFLENMIYPCSMNLDYDDMVWLFEKTNNNTQISITNINKEDTIEVIEEKISKSIVCKGRNKKAKKIIINALAPNDGITYNEAYKIIQQVAIITQGISHEDCHITFSLNFKDKIDQSVEILIVQV